MGAWTGLQVYKYVDKKNPDFSFYFPVYEYDPDTTLGGVDAAYTVESYNNYGANKSYNAWNYPIPIIAVVDSGTRTSYFNATSDDSNLYVNDVGQIELIYNGVTATGPFIDGNFDTLATGLFGVFHDITTTTYNVPGGYNRIVYCQSLISGTSPYYNTTTITEYPSKTFGKGTNQGFHTSSNVYYGLKYRGSGGDLTDQYTDFANLLVAASIPYDSDDPYNGGDTPDPDDGGDGDFDYNSDEIPIPDIPSVSVTDSGMVRLFAPTKDQLISLADYLWSDAFSLESFKKLFNNPMDAILGLYLIPVNVGTGAATEITVGNIVTTVSCNTVTTQFVTVDCGTFTFSKSAFTNSFLDWSPYTKVYLYLPFIGTQEISIDEFMGTTMHVVYHVDVLTGAMLCYVSNNVQGVMYEYMGQCAENVPLSSTSYSNTVGSILNAAASIGGVVATAVTGGAAAPVALGMLAGASSATAQAASSLKPSISHSGNIGGGAGMMGVKYPYLIFITPRTSIPSSQYKYTGTPSNKVVTLSSLKDSGFNQVEAINLSIAGATDTECTEIENTLKAGVIL